MLGGLEPKRVLDVGCGTGIAAAHFDAGLRVGVDPARKLLELASDKGGTVGNRISYFMRQLIQRMVAPIRPSLCHHFLTVSTVAPLPDKGNSWHV